MGDLTGWDSACLARWGLQGRPWGTGNQKSRLMNESIWLPQAIVTGDLTGVSLLLGFHVAPVKGGGVCGDPPQCCGES